LAYGLLGYSWFDFDNLRVSAVDSGGGGGFSAMLNEPIRNGITVGGGIEQKITSDFSLKAEYR
jgi:opacity protein-like surface antigen